MERSVSGGPSEQASPSQLCRLPRCPSPGKGTPAVGTYGKGPGVPEMPQEEGPDCLQRDQPRILRPSFQRRKEGGWPGGFCAFPDSSGFKDRSFSLLSECVRGPSVWRAHGWVESHWAHRAPPSTLPQGTSAELWREAVRPLPVLCPLTPT